MSIGLTSPRSSEEENHGMGFLFMESGRVHFFPRETVADFIE